MTKSLVILLALATAAIHISRALADPEISVLFVLNALGYVVLVVALYFIPQLQARRRWVRWALIGYTVVTIVFYLIWGAMSGEWVMPLGPLDKVIEVALIALLWQEDRQLARAK